jgi:DNA-binding NtrC family response regulator
VREVESRTWKLGPGQRPEAIQVRKCRLDVVAGPDAGLSAVFASPTILVGRRGADLALTDRRVSALHLEIRLEEDGYRLRDVGSTNGTYAWGMRVLDTYIGPGASIGLGDSVVRFVPLPDSVELPLWHDSRLGGLVGESATMRRIFDVVDRVAASDSTVLITGETGTGKELVAEAIHERSPRAKGPFVVVDCGAIPASLFEDQLFGHESGAFTGAARVAHGLFEAAQGGTLFLDELGELPLELQPKLLRALESRRIQRIGGSRQIQCDVRFVAATNRDLAAEINRKAFRSDLYFRVAVARVAIPALRERPEDIPHLVEHFLAQLPGASLPDGFLPWAQRQGWPGNVRELRNAVERAVVTQSVPDPDARRAHVLQIDLATPFREAKRALLDEFERRYAKALLEAHDWNITAASRSAGVDRMSIYKLLSRLDLERGQGS